MENLMEELLTGRYKYLIWFGAAIVFIYIPGVYLWMRRRKEKAMNYEREHPEAVKVYIKRTELDDSLFIISIDNEKPVLFSKGIKYGYYLLPGEHIIHVRCQWTSISITSISGYETHTIENEEFNVTVEANKKYLLYCDRTSEKFEFNEN